MNEGAAFKSARLAALAGPCRFDDAEALAPLITAIKARHGASVLGVIFYGSCLRSADIRNGLVDFYVIVDHYRRAHDSLLSAAANRLVPPNVYYLEAADSAPNTGADKPSRLRCKYAVISEAELAYGCRDALTSGLWGRLAQPVAIVYRDRPFRVQADGDFHFVTSLSVGPAGFPVADTVRDMAAGFRCAALIGVVVAPTKSGKKPKPGKPFLVGRGGEIVPREDGLLFLKINAPTGHKCTGRLRVRISGNVRKP